MIERYSLKAMSEIWKPESRFHYMLQVEQAAASAQAEMGIIPKSAAKAIASKAKISYKNILKREEKTKHDVAAFVDEASSRLGAAGAYFHYGLTSSDVLDTALALQIQSAHEILLEDFKALKKTLKGLVQKHKADLCPARTHGVHAEPTTFGYKMLGHLLELKRAQESFSQAVLFCSKGKMSGAAGVYSALPPALEARVCSKLGLQPEPLSTQVVPRDRLARLVFSMSLTGAFIERLAVELRHLQKTETAEAAEGFSKGQTGSSAMPHKKNPISAENLTGLARLLRSYSAPALENIVLWHERDISHSSVERVILPDAFTLMNYALNRLNSLLKRLQPDTRRMRENMELSGGLLYSSQALNALVKKGLPRRRAYPLVQKISHGMKKGENLKSLFQKNSEIKKYLSAKDLEEIFSGKKSLKALLKHLEETLKKV